MNELWAVTGAAGFIGRKLIAVLGESDARIRVLVRGEGGPSAVVGSITDADALRKLVAGSNVVVHLAAYVHRRADTNNEKQECRATNVEGTRLLIDAISSEAPGAFLIFFSSASVYAPSTEALDEHAAISPKTFYGKTKLEAEQLVLDAVRTGRLHAAILRPGMVCGVDGPGNLRRLLALLRLRLAPMLGGGRFRKSVIPVEMVVEAIIGVAAHSMVCNGNIFNAGGATLTMRRIIELLEEGLGISAVRLPFPRFPVRLAAAIADSVMSAMQIRTSPFVQIVDAYSTPVVLNDEKLRRIVSLGGEREVEVALRRAAHDSTR